MTAHETWDVLTVPRDLREGVIPFRYDDGGRATAGLRGPTGDCSTRAIAIATGKPYREVYDALNATALVKSRPMRRTAKTRNHGRARTGVSMTVIREYLATLGWRWVPTMLVGTGCVVHCDPAQLPQGRLILRLTKHMTAMIDGVIHDTYNPSRGGRRCVYGYFIQEGA